MKRTEPEPANRPKPAPPQPLRLVLDVGEQLSGLPARVRALWEHVLVERLETGDAEIGRILVERKAARDFVISLRSGRLFRQAYALRSACARPLVLVEGDPYAIVPPGRAAGLRGAILALLTGYGIPVLRTRGLQETAETLVQIARQESRRASRRERRARQTRASPPEPTTAERAAALRCLGALPGVGQLRADALLEHFGSLERLFGATWAELCEVPGVGGATAAGILQALAAQARSEAGGAE